MAGRAGDVYDFIEDDDGKMQLHKTGTKMQAEKNLGYEPGLAIEMERVNKGDFKKGERNFVNRAHILKDRFDILDGQMFDNPTFETFLPHIQRLNLGVHRAIDSTNSTALFAKDSKDNWAEQRKKAEILCEEIQGVMVAAYPGRTTEEVQAKNGLLQEGFGTYSWTAVQGMDPDQIAKGLAVIKEKIAHLKERPVGHTNGAKVKKGVEA
jgi:hypothetical protein